jgi:hypothetical protein
MRDLARSAPPPFTHSLLCCAAGKEAERIGSPRNVRRQAQDFVLEQQRTAALGGAMGLMGGQVRNMPYYVAHTRVPVNQLCMQLGIVATTFGVLVWSRAWCTTSCALCVSR